MAGSDRSLAPVDGREVQAAAGSAPRPLPTMRDLSGDGIAHAHPGVLLPRLLGTARARALWFEEALAEQIEREGLAGVVGTEWVRTVDGRVVEAGETIRALAQAEAAERDRAASLATQITKLGIDHGKVTRELSEMASWSLRTFVAELGFNIRDQRVLDTARRAALIGRRSAGMDDPDPDKVIRPKLTAAEQVAVLEQTLSAVRPYAERGEVQS